MSKYSILLYGDYTFHYLASSYCRAFETLGYKVLKCDTRNRKMYLYYWLRNRVLHRATIANLKLRNFGSTKWNQFLIKYANETQPDFLFILGGEMIMPQTIRTIQNMRIKVLIFHPDNPFPPFPNRRPEYIPAAMACDVYFIWSQSLRERLLKLGVKRVEYLPFAWDEDVFPYAENQSVALNDEIIFIGGWDTDRENFLEALSTHYPVKIWGPNYWVSRTSKDSVLRKCWQGKELVAGEAAKKLAQSAISLNLLRSQNLPDGTNMRTFELSGCGAFQLSNYSSGAAELLPESSGCSYFRTVQECVEKVQYFLSNPVLRTGIKYKAHDIVAQHHRYQNRVQQIIQVVESIK